LFEPLIAQYEDSLFQQKDPFLSQCGFGAVDRTDTDQWTTVRTPQPYFNPLRKISQLSAEAKLHGSDIPALAATRRILEQISLRREPHSRYIDSLQVRRLISIPAALAHDAVNPIYHITRTSIALWRQKLKAKNAEVEVLDWFMSNIIMSLEVLMIILQRLHLETPQSLRDLIKERGFLDLLALARFLEAFGSRHAPQGTIHLGSGKLLSKEHCSGLAGDHFDQIHSLKDEIASANLAPTYNSLEASCILRQCLARGLQTLKGSMVERNENHVDLGVLQILREVRQGLPSLIADTSNNIVCYD
jgi:hypothetical protein